MKKAPEAFRTISEVADLLDTPAHVLRFWESKFYQIRPVKRAGGRRYYRPDDVALINGIKTLLQDRGMTIRGAQRILQEQGVKAVAQMGLPLPHGGALLRVVASNHDPYDDSLEEGPDEALATDEIDGDLAEAPVPDAPALQPQDELTMEMQPSSGYPVDKAEGDEASRIAADLAAEEQPQGDGAANAPDQAPVEDTAMSSDDLLTPLADPVPEVAPPAPDLLGALLRPRPPVTPPMTDDAVPTPPQGADIPEPARLAQALRALPRQGPGVQRDRLAIMARRIDALLERMSEASGAGRW